MNRMQVTGSQNRRPIVRFSRPATAHGFTLVEVLIVLLLFSLILAMGYRAISDTAVSRKAVMEKVHRQEALRSSHRTLANAFSSRAQFQGLANRVDLDLTTADSPWLNEAKALVLLINQQGQLRAYIDKSAADTILVDGLEQASFEYFKDGLGYASWNQATRPDWVEFRWVEKGQQLTWRFLSSQ